MFNLNRMYAVKPVVVPVLVLLAVLAIEFWLVPGSFMGSDLAYSDPLAKSQSKHGFSPEQVIQMAQHGDAEAQWRLGVLYLNGDGVRQNDTEAAAWFHRSADQGYVPALNALANQHWAGRGVPQDYNKAYFWFDVALAKGDEAAASRLEVLGAELTQDEAAHAHAEALAWIQQHK
jgi:TPR repeat protein